MSAWTEVTGTVTFRRDCGMSLSTMIVEMFEEAHPKITQQHGHITNKITATIAFNFSDSNINAAKTLQTFINRIKEFDSSAWIDLEANIRFLG